MKKGQVPGPVLFSSFHFHHLHRLNLAGIKRMPLVFNLAKIYGRKVYAADVYIVGCVVIYLSVGKVN